MFLSDRALCPHDGRYMANAIPEYGWESCAAEDAHGYIWPAIRSFIPEGAGLRIMDLGCGNGWVAGQLAQLGHRVSGIDPSRHGIALAAERYPGVQFEELSVYDDLSVLGVASYDVVVSSEVIEHLYQPRVLLERASQLLVPDGVLIVTTPFHGYWKNLALSIANKWDDHFTVGRDGGHIKFFSEKTLAAMLGEAGFGDLRFNNAGRLPGLWKSMVVCARMRGFREA